MGVFGELVAFVSFLSLSISVFLESLKHVFDIIVVFPLKEKNTSVILTAHGKGSLLSIDSVFFNESFQNIIIV